MKPCQRDAGKILGALDITDPWPKCSRLHGEEIVQMRDVCASRLCCAVSLIDNRSTVADQYNVRVNERYSHPHRMDQRQPFCVHTGPVSDIALDMSMPADNNCDLHSPRIRTAPPIEENL